MTGGSDQRRNLALVLLTMAFVVVALLSIPELHRKDHQDLAGSWTLTVQEPVVLAERTVQVPLAFRTLSLDDPAPLLTLERPILVPDSPTAIWLERPAFAVEVYLDGLLLTRRGDLSRDGERAQASLLVPLPSDIEPGQHQLQVKLRGDWNRGGLTGRVVLGDLSGVALLASQVESTVVGFAIGFMLLGLLNVGVAVRSSSRTHYLLYGVFSFSIAGYAYFHSGHAMVMLPDPLDLHRVNRLWNAAIAAFGVLFISVFMRRRFERPVQAYVVTALVLGIVATLLPGPWLFLAEAVQDAWLVVGLFAAGFALYTGLRDKIAGSLMLAMSFAPLVAGAAMEMLYTHGFTAGGTWLYGMLALFLVGCSVAVAMQDAATSDRFRRLVSGSADAMITVDPKGVVRDMNAAAMVFLGPAGTGLRLVDRVYQADKAIAKGHIQRGQLQATRAEFRLLVAGEEVVVESMATPQGEGWSLLVLRDVTRRRQMDESLLQAARMETVGVLLGGIAHDFNNMLGTLLAHVGILRLKADPSQVPERLDKMEDAIERASMLVRRLLALGGRGSSDLETLDLQAVVQVAIGLVEPTLPRDVTVTADLGRDLPRATGAAQDLEQVFVNLLVNARDALGATGGNIRVVIRAFDVPAGPRGLAVMIEDDGPGIVDDLAKNIWRPFFTTKGKRGTGLGLSVAEQILRNHYGRIWYEDNPNGGARFIVALRLAMEDAEGDLPMPEGRKLLVVDDERMVLDGFAEALSAAGYEVEAHSDPVKAMAWLAENEPDMLVTDVVMPAISGLQLAAHCKDTYPRCPVLLVSGFIPQASLEHIDPEFGRLDKPVRAQRVVETVTRMRRQAERAAGGEPTTGVLPALFEPFDDLTSEQIGL